MNFDELLVLWNSNHKNRKDQITMSYLCEYVVSKAKLVLELNDDDFFEQNSKKIVSNLNILVEEKNYNKADFVFCVSVIDFKSNEITTSCALFDIKVSCKKIATAVIAEQIFLRRKEILKAIYDYGDDNVIKKAKETVDELDNIIKDVFLYSRDNNISQAKIENNNPIDIKQWIDDSYYIGVVLKNHLYQNVKNAVISIIENKENRLFLTGDVGIGKTICQKILMIRKLYELSVIEDVHKRLEFYNSSTIDIVFLSPKADKRMLELHMKQFLSLISEIPYFTNNFKILFVDKNKIIFPNNIVVSFENSLSNKNVLYAFSDNDFLYEETVSKVCARINTRFSQKLDYSFVCVIPDINIKNVMRLCNFNVFCLS